MSEIAQRDLLKQHFARRVTNQARMVIDSYQKCTLSQWKDADATGSLIEQSERLAQYAKRFDMTELETAGYQIMSLLKLCSGSPNTSKDVKKSVAKTIAKLSQSIKRKSDTQSQPSNASKNRTFVQPPVIIALNDTDLAEKIVEQLDFFGFRSKLASDIDSAESATNNTQVETMIIDVDFQGKHQGIELAQRIKATTDTAPPIIFISTELDDISTRLAASRAGGEEFFFGNATISDIVEKVGKYHSQNKAAPYRVLIVDDSRSQAKYIENILKSHEMDVAVIHNPLDALNALHMYKPEIILMDMYMPECTGMELARVIRQQDNYHSTPIIYLSAEDDVNKQLDAMSQGGDDFLTKPVNPKQLINTIQNRGRRARAMHAMLVRDSLTGLYNHSHIMQLLSDELELATQEELNLSFVMIDLDHFKSVNDSHGHLVGDQVLKNLSLFLKQRLRQHDHIGRYGGEEFALILPNTSESEARNIVNDIRERFSKIPHNSSSSSFFCTFSSGIYSHSKNAQGNTVSSICESADQALYDAKNGQRNCVRVFRNKKSKPNNSTQTYN
jgi:diguanylate cyclase (GGDEF)-like protein